MVRQPKEVITSGYYEEHLVEILGYGIEVFGYAQAKKYFHTVSQLVENLGSSYTVYPECRHLATKNRIYRNIILDAHLIIYRITDERIEVLDIVHSASSIRKIRGARKVHP
jgi:plasmid stabilization system protein ParE